MFHAGFFLGVIFKPEEGGDMFLRKAGWLSTDYIPEDGILKPKKM
jgi:hypothetical protein